MAITASKPGINIREKLSELDHPQGIKGTEVLRADTAEDVRNAIGARGRRNVLINGGFDIWQRGVGDFDGDGGVKYTADRWNIHQPTGASKVYQGSTTDPTVVDQFRGTTFVHDVTTGGFNGRIAQRIENVRTLSGKKVTLSMWVNGVDGAKTFDVEVRQRFGTGGSTDVILPIQSVTADFGVWKKVTLTFDVPSVQGKTIGADSYLQLAIYSGETAGTVEFGNIQLEEGEIATDFEVLPIGTELSLCQRYYWKDFNSARHLVVSQYSTNNQGFYGSIDFPVTMRESPSCSSIPYQHSGLTGSPNLGTGPGTFSFTARGVDSCEVQLQLDDANTDSSGAVSLANFTANAEL